MSAIFTDNNKEANSFIKELYIGANWKTTNPSERLILFLARNYTYSTGVSLITMVLESTYDPVAGECNHGFITIDSSNGVIKLDTVGRMTGVDCYAVVDWNTLFTPTNHNNYGGEIDFYAEIYVDAATNLDNSPTIKSYLLQQALTHRINTVLIPNCSIDPQPQWTDFPTNSTYNVYTFNELKNALNNANAMINICCDIALSEQITISKNIKINGNGHKIFEYVAPNTTPVLESGMKKLPFSGTLDANDGFTTPDGTLLELKRSEIYRATWLPANPNTHVYGLSCPNLPQNIPTNEIIYIHVRFSFMRKTYRVHSVLGTNIYFTVDDWNSDTDSYEAITPHPDFFLSNFDDGNTEDGVLVKGNYMFFPTQYQSLHYCTYNDILPITNSNLKVDVSYLTIVGGKISCIRNFATLRLRNCELTNPLCHGVINDGNSFIENCTFHDIKEHGIYSNRYYESGYPYLRLVNNVFSNIALYGSNHFGVFSNGIGYIANNEFIDNNYGSIYIGLVSSETNINCRNLVEHNYIHFTSEWINKRKRYGLQDSGAIYLALNHEKAIVRYNRIFDVGGLDEESCQTTTYGNTRKNVAIYADDGTYNAIIYGNIIQGTENYYDIDCRAQYLDAEKIKPAGQEVCVNNFVSFNFCDGFVRIQHNLSPNVNHQCVFNENFVQGKLKRGELEHNIINEVYDYISGEAIEERETGIMSACALSDLLNRDERYGAADVFNT